MFHRRKKGVELTEVGHRFVRLTEDWLRLHGVYPDELQFLVMRSDGDSRPDEITKAQMLEALSDSYEVRMVFDDRQKVVDMWRSKGLLCLQVAPGEF